MGTQYTKQKLSTDIYEDFLSTKTESYSGGTNTETKKLLYISTEKTEEDISISSENLGEVNRYIYDILRDKMSGMVTVFVS